MVVMSAVILIKSDDHQRATHEVGIGQLGLQKTLQPVGPVGNAGVVCIVLQVGRVITKLWQCVGSDVGVELVSIHNFGAARGVGANAIERNKRVVFANI